MIESRRELLSLLELLGEAHPEMRFGQLITNLANWATHQRDALWDVEDELLLEAARKHLERSQQKVL
jgi:hypothetical protein